MEEQNNIRITELSQKPAAEPEDAIQQKQKLKKAAIFFLMGIVCLGCLYMIFSPMAKDKKEAQPGINEIVPQASVDAMDDDKGKAYEKELLSKKQQDDRNALTTLSEYWNSETTQHATPTQSGISEDQNPAGHQQQALNSYKNVQAGLGNFYEPNRDESTAIRNEVRSLRSQLSEKNTEPNDPVANQLALMEKSYQMAARYFPQSGVKTNPTNVSQRADSSRSVNEKQMKQPVYNASKQVVSALYREPADSIWLAGILSGKSSRKFYTVGNVRQVQLANNAIRACVDQAQTITQEGTVRLRLLENIRLATLTIPKGSVWIATARFQGVRLQLHISSVEYQGNIIPVDMLVYDLEGQPGLAIPFSPERSAITEMVANMGNTGGTSVSLSSTAGQQITTDLSKSIVQGISGYFAKKVRMPQITLKAGLEVFIISKK